MLSCVLSLVGLLLFLLGQYGYVAVSGVFVLSPVDLLPFPVGLFCLRWLCCHFWWVCSVFGRSVAVSGGSVLSPVGLLPFPVGLFCLRWVCCRFRWVCSVSGRFFAVSGGSILSPMGLLRFPVGLFCFRWVSVAVSEGSIALFGESLYVVYPLRDEFQFSFCWVSFLSGWYVLCTLFDEVFIFPVGLFVL